MQPCGSGGWRVAGAIKPAGTLETILSSVERSFGPRDDHHMDDWHRTVQTYGQLYYAQPLNALIPDLTADLLEVGRFLKTFEPPSRATALLLVRSLFTALMATDFNDGRETGAQPGSPGRLPAAPQTPPKTRTSPCGSGPERPTACSGRTSHDP